jgi:hypothetical protein
VTLPVDLCGREERDKIGVLEKRVQRRILGLYTENMGEKILRRIYGPVVEQGIWRIRSNQELCGAI